MIHQPMLLWNIRPCWRVGYRAHLLLIDSSGFEQKDLACLLSQSYRRSPWATPLPGRGDANSSRRPPCLSRARPPEGPRSRHFGLITCFNTKSSLEGEFSIAFQGYTEGTLAFVFIAPLLLYLQEQVAPFQGHKTQYIETQSAKSGRTLRTL